MLPAPLTSADPGHAPRVAPSAPRRPGETYARVEVPLPLRRQLALAGAGASVPLDVAATLIAEAALLLESLDARRLSRGRELLDRAARSSRVTRALSSSSADYLRALSCRSWRRQAAEVDLPVRVTSRISAEPGRYLARDDLLEDAIRWETAALLCERSMANWGTDVVLGGFR